MNGVHSQIMTRITEPSAWVDSQATWCTPNGCSSQFTSPNCGSSIGPAHTSAAATGMTRNGVMISVRTMLRPRNLRSSSTANSTPRIMATITAVAVMTTERTSAPRKAGLVNTAL